MTRKDQSINLRLRLTVIGLGSLIVIAVFTFPYWQPFLVSDEVDEAFPGLPLELQPAFRALPHDQQRAFFDMRREDPERALAMAQAALSPPVVATPDPEATADMPDLLRVASGRFVEIDILHKASGTVTIYQRPDDRYVLMLNSFRVTNGPDLHIILTRFRAPRTAEDVGLEGTGYREVDFLRATVGDQRYDIPADVDLSQFRSVVIYCKKFGVVFSTANLQ